MEVLYPRCAGLDVHQQTVVACARIASGATVQQEVRTFGTTTGDLFAGTAITGEAGGDVEIGNATAGESIDLTSGGSIGALSLDAPTVSLSVAGDFTTGNLFVDNTLLISAGGN